MPLYACRPDLGLRAMPVATNSPPASTINLAPYKPGDHVATHGDFRDQLFRDGYCVVKNAFSAERSNEYASAGHDWLESFGLGYKRDDPSTFKMENVPAFHKGGLYNNFGVGQEQFAWNVRQEPGVIDAFAKIWGTEELLVSFDAVNLSIPLAKAPGAEGIFKPWAHVDQSPNRQFFHCVQGIANLAENGPDDGGLMVLQGSKELYNECFAKFDHQKGPDGWTDVDSYHHTPEMLDWMVNEKGCTWHKVCAGPGDLILWDSRTVHYGAPPKGAKARTAVYVAYKPAALCSPEKMAQRHEAMDKLWTTTHDPVIFRIIDPAKEPFPNAPGWNVRKFPVKKPVLTERGLKLAGLVPY